MYLNKQSTERLLEQLEDAQALLAQMLTSRYIGPLREEAASWAEKLKEVAEVLEQWLEVQDLWQYLEAVFSNNDTAKVCIIFTIFILTLNFRNCYADTLWCSRYVKNYPNT